MRELVKDQESVQFIWNDPALEKHEVAIYRYDYSKYDGYFHDEIMMIEHGRNFWKTLIGMGFTLKPLAPPSSYED